MTESHSDPEAQEILSGHSQAPVTKENLECRVREINEKS